MGSSLEMGDSSLGATSSWSPDGIDLASGALEIDSPLVSEKQNALFVLGKEKVLAADISGQHVMAVHFVPGESIGVYREIPERDGDPGIAGCKDTSILRLVTREPDGQLTKGAELQIDGEDDVVLELMKAEAKPILGREDPTIVKGKDGLIHLFYTVAFPGKKSTEYSSYIMHASGKDIKSLKARGIVLSNAKEVTLPPENSRGETLALFEGALNEDGVDFSTIGTVSLAEATLGDSAWRPLDYLVVNPADRDNLPDWLHGHASPGPILAHLPDEQCVIIALNGRGANIPGEDGQPPKFSPFEIGLGRYNYETGVMEAVTIKPIIYVPDEEIDGQKANIVFASDAVKDYAPGVDGLYAHVHDSYIALYKLDRARMMQFIDDQNNWMKLRTTRRSVD